MKTIIIVDDEKTIREGLAILLKNTGNYKILATFKNGNEALPHTIKLNPDIVITDICMPILDGFEYIKKCIETKVCFTKFIVISGYEDFEYARSALKLKVHDYITKPIGHANLVSVVDNASKIIDEEISQKMLLHNQIGSICLSSKSVNKKFENLKKTGIDFTEFSICIIPVKNCLPVSREIIKNEIDKTLLRNSLKDFLSFWYKEKIVILFNYDIKATKYFRSSFVKLLDLLKNMLKINCVIGIGGSYCNINNITRSYFEALYALFNSLYEKNNIIISKPEWIIESNIEKYCSEEKSQLLNAVNDCDRKNATEIINLFLQKIQTENVPPNALYQIINSLIDDIYSIIHDTNEADLPQTIKILPDSDFVLFRNNINEFKSELIKLINVAISGLENFQNSHYGFSIDRIIRYISLNYQKDISLNFISENFNINISYFCKIFKNKTGKTCKQYLTDLRIEHAKDMLLHNDLKVYEIAALVGFKDANYFTKIFKRLCSITPNEYRERNIKLKE